ncbi:dnaJ homolog subfamily B member 7-like [Artemia franciscana]
MTGMKAKEIKAEVRKSYRFLAMRWHPDKNRNNEKEATSRFQEILKAYEVLVNDEKRENYNVYSFSTTSGTSDSSRASDSSGTKKKSFQCRVCYQIFLNRDDLTYHMGVGCTFPCRVCKKIFLNRDDFNYHMGKYKKSYQCIVCKKISLSVDDHIYHMGMYPGHVGWNILYA